jgi:hypothetical protein
VVPENSVIVGTYNHTFGMPILGGSELMETFENKLNGSKEASRECPDCHRKKIWKAGTRLTQREKFNIFCGVIAISVKIASNVEKTCKLLEIGFEYVTESETKKLFKKRK